LADYKNQVRVMLRLDSNAPDQALNAQIFAIGAQRPAELQKNGELFQQAIASIDEKSGSINLNIEYSIEKIENAKDGKPFLFNVSYKQDSIDGIKYLEVWNLANIYLEKESQEAKPSAVAATALPANPSTIAATLPQTTQIAAPAAPAESSPAQAATVAAPIPSPVPVVEPQASSIASVPQQVSIPANMANAKIEASFDCAKAATSIEKLICSSPQSATADKNLASEYNLVKKAMGNNFSQIRSDQLKWLKEVRSTCTDVACLVKVMDARTEQLAVESD
jgi:hypothetical protein